MIDLDLENVAVMSEDHGQGIELEVVIVQVQKIFRREADATESLDPGQGSLSRLGDQGLENLYQGGQDPESLYREGKLCQGAQDLGSQDQDPDPQLDLNLRVLFDLPGIEPQSRMFQKLKRKKKIRRKKIKRKNGVEVILSVRVIIQIQSLTKRS